MTADAPLAGASFTPLDRSPGLVRVWRVRLDRAQKNPAEPEKFLSRDETERANRFCFDRDRRRFTVARAALRAILAQYLDQRPEEIEFLYGIHGKPALSGPPAGLRFNVSHSHEIALVAVAFGREVGLDLEYERPMPDLERLVAANCSRREAAAFAALPEAERPAAFFAMWTRKEAYLKARGDGLAVPLNHFTVSLAPQAAARLEIENDPLEAGRWRMVDLPALPGYAGALVAEGTDWHFDCFDWDW